MFKYWTNRILRRPSVRVFDQGSILYRENGRVIRIGVQMLETGFSLDVGSIISWNDRPEEVLKDAERYKIANAAKSTIESQWGENAYFQNS